MFPKFAFFAKLCLHQAIVAEPEDESNRCNHSLSQSGQAIYSLPKSAKQCIPCAALLSLNGTTVNIEAAELLLITKKERSYEIIENPTPYVWDVYSGHDNAISIRISSVSCADCF